jgi:C_GCAxxG_C_C family probable redox protein
VTPRNPRTAPSPRKAETPCGNAQARVAAGDDPAVCALRLAEAKHLCAESVFAALVYANGWDIPRPTALATGLCSGMSRTRGQCGALSGAVLALGFALGRTSPDQSLEPCYGAVETLVEEFRARFGGRDCREILGLDVADPQELAEFRRRNLWTSRCAELIEFAVTRAQELLDGEDFQEANDPRESA